VGAVGAGTNQDRWFTKNRICAIPFSLAESDLRVVAANSVAGGKDRKIALETFLAQPEARVEKKGSFFI
jgi:hypothetical protein